MLSRTMDGRGGRRLPSDTSFPKACRERAAVNVPQPVSRIVRLAALTRSRVPPSTWELDEVPELAPWLEIVAEANAISFFSWYVREDRLVWSQGAEERMGLPAGAVESYGRWRSFVMPEDAASIEVEAVRLIGAQAPIMRFRYRSMPLAGGPRFMELVGHCVYDRHGRMTRLVGAVRDITESVENARDLRHLRDQFLRRARLDSLGAVAAGLAHELNQPLSAAANFLSAMRLGVGANGSEALLSQADRAAQQVALAGEIIRRLRTFLSGEDRMPDWLPVAALIEDSLALALPGGERRRMSVTVQVDPELRVFGDRVQLQQAIINIIANAVSAMATMPRDARLIVIAATRLQAQVEITMADAGPGFSPDLLQGFDLPFTSTTAAHGMGLGLSICRHIIQEQGGDMTVANGEQGGAVIRFRLPAEREGEAE